MADLYEFDAYRKLQSLDTEMPAPTTLNRRGGDGTSGGVTDDWKNGVDRRLDQLHGDLRAMLSRGVAAIVVLALGIAGLYLYTNEKFEKIDQRLTAMEVQQARSDASTGGKLDVLLERTSKK